MWRIYMGLLLMASMLVRCVNLRELFGTSSKALVRLLDVATHYRHEMHRRFPELALCEFDWKAEQIAC